MPQTSGSANFTFPCNLIGCDRLFNSKQGLAIHQRTCITKQAEREQVARYEAEVQAEHTRLEAEGKDLSVLCRASVTYYVYSDL